MAATWWKSQLVTPQLESVSEQHRCATQSLLRNDPERCRKQLLHTDLWRACVGLASRARQRLGRIWDTWKASPPCDGGRVALESPSLWILSCSTDTRKASRRRASSDGPAMHSGDERDTCWHLNREDLCLFWPQHCHLCLVPLVAPGAVIRPFIRVRPHVFPDVPDGLVQFAALAALVPPLADVDLHVFLQQVPSQKLLFTHCALKRLITCKEINVTSSGYRDTGLLDFFHMCFNSGSSSRKVTFTQIFCKCSLKASQSCC